MDHVGNKRGRALIILYMMAPYVAGFFGSPGAVLVLQVIGITLLLEGLTNLGTIFFLKELDFKRQFLFQFSGVLADFMVAVIAVLVLHNRLGARVRIDRKGPDLAGG